MPQRHPHQQGMFHVTTSTLHRMRQCVMADVPEHLIHHLCTTRGMQAAKLYAFCILPDHMHILLSPGPKGLSAFMHAFKKNSAREIPQLVWQKGYHDELIRDEKQCGAVIGYIQGNAMKHDLVNDILDWPWTSLHHQGALDPMEIWM